MSETPIAQMWLDARAQTIYGGTSEVMKHIIGKTLAG
jgi:alkylation response protein AidB-like acyl-CoA dehydrogenase